MKRGRSSQTAILVTFARALADAGLTHVQGFSDPTARKLLPPGWLKRLEKVERRPRSGALHEVTLRAGDAMATRTMVIDAKVREAVAGGAKQLVILGAGLDGRGYRMRELAGVDVFEVDHLDTQAAKREQVAKLAQTARSVHFVATDFERDALHASLDAAGHHAGERTIWVWEGVVMYLTDEAVRATLAAVSARSAPGSTLVVQYNTREGQSTLGKLLLWLWSEPQVGLRSREQMASEVTAAGFRIVSDSGASDWAAQLGAAAPRSSSARRMRIVVGQR